MKIKLSRRVFLILTIALSLISTQSGFGAALMNAKDGVFSDTERFEAVALMEKNLEKAFNSICDDTFCEGEYTTIKHIALNCFINGDTAIVDSCHWDFAGSYAYADGDIIIKDARSFQCVFRPQMTIQELTSTINKTVGKRMVHPEKVFHVPLNAKGETLFDGLSDCL